ncbi:hypothetical protein ACTXT7_001897 [Hymenolepis weldensis]
MSSFEFKKKLDRLAQDSLKWDSDSPREKKLYAELVELYQDLKHSTVFFVCYNQQKLTEDRRSSLKNS